MSYPSIDTEIPIEILNAEFKQLSFQKRIALLYEYFAEDEVLVTSSFGTKSVFLLHLLSTIRPTQKIHFIDTTYHFPETIDYKNKLIKLLDIEVINILPDVVQNDLTREETWWESHPKMCCSINKIAPLEPAITRHKIWIAGLMAWQTPFRSRLNIFEQQGDIVKFHPFVDIDEGEFLYHLSYHELPRHPLEKHGYGSIGCTHCTAQGQGRSGRWQGKNKTECGLHPNYFVR